MADYNINAVERKVSYTGSAGLGPYSFLFEILTETDIVVYLNQTLLTITTDYTVTINANGTGSVTLVTGGSVATTPTASDLVVIVGARDIERTTDFVTAGDLRASALNEQLDALTIMVQQVSEEVARSVKAPVYDPTGINMVLPKKADRVNAFVAFDANGDISAAVPSDDVTTLAEVATDIKNLADIEDGTIATDAISDTAAIASDITAVAAVDAQITLLGTADAIADMNTLGTAAIVADLDAVADKVTEIGRLGTADAVADMAILGTADVVSDMNTLATAAIVADMDALANVTAEMALLGTADAIADMNTLGTADVVADMNTLGTAATVSDMSTLADISADIQTLADIEDGTDATDAIQTVAGISSDVTAVAAKSTEVGRLGTADAVADMAILGTADVVADMNTLGTAAIVADMDTLADRATDIGTLADIEDGTVATTAISSLAALSTEIQALYAELASIAAKVSKTGDTMTGDLILNTTGALTLPVGTEAQRPSPVKGMFRFNDDSDAFEGYDGAAWGAVGGGNTAVVGWENQITVAEDYTMTSGNNMVSAGPITIDTGFTVTVPTGSRWVVV